MASAGPIRPDTQPPSVIGTPNGAKTSIDDANLPTERKRHGLRPEIAQRHSETPSLHRSRARLTSLGLQLVTTGCGRPPRRQRRWRPRDRQLSLFRSSAVAATQKWSTSSAMSGRCGHDTSSRTWRCAQNFSPQLRLARVTCEACRPGSADEAEHLVAGKPGLRHRVSRTRKSSKGRFYRSFSCGCWPNPETNETMAEMV